MWTTGYYGYLSDYLLWWAVVLSLVVHTWCFFRFYPRARYPRAFVVVGNGLVALCLFSAAGIVAESYLRFLSTSTDTFGATLTCKRWKAAYAPTNSLGHRDQEWPELKPAGVRRIAFVGDSFVYGWGIDDPQNRFSDIIQTRFDQLRLGAVEVMNFAWADWDTRDQAQHLERFGSAYGIDEVVLCYLPNDIQKLLPKPKELDPTKPPKATWIRTDSSFLVDYLYHRVFAPRARGSVNYFDWLADGFADAPIWRQHEEDLGRIIQWCRGHNVKLRVALLPFLKTSGKRYNPTNIHGKLASFFELNEVPVVDLLSAIRDKNPKALVVNAHDAHPNETANALFAEAIWKAFYTDNP